MAQRQTANLVNGIDVDILHETIDAVKQDPELGKCRFRAKNKWIDGDHNRTTISDYFAAGEERTHKRSFEVDADEPPMMAGDDDTPSPTEYLLNALASCVTTSIVAQAAVRGIHVFVPLVAGPGGGLTPGPAQWDPLQVGMAGTDFNDTQQWVDDVEAGQSEYRDATLEILDGALQNTLEQVDFNDVVPVSWSPFGTPSVLTLAASSIKFQ